MSYRVGDTVTVEGPAGCKPTAMKGTVIGVFRDFLWVWWEAIDQTEIVEQWQVQKLPMVEPMKGATQQ